MMKKTFTPIILLIVIIVSCNKKIDEKIYFISEEPEHIFKNNVIFKSTDSLSMFYDLMIIDSFVVTADSYSDTVVKIYKNFDFSRSLFSALKGNGARDVIGSIDINKAVYFDSIVLFEMDTRRIKKIQIDNNNIFKNFKSEFLRGNVMPSEFNMTNNYIGGWDMISNKIFIINKNDQSIIKIDYFPNAGIEYDNIRLQNVYTCKPIINEEKQSVCAAMFYVNCVNFFNLKGELKKSIVVGDKLHFPKPDTERIFDKNEKIYFSSICGTPDYVYCLYAAIKFDEKISDVKIFIFNWEGEHITTIKTNGNIFRIAAEKNNEYLLGLSAREGWNSTDIVKIPLDGVFSKQKK